jgi:hypothetical protein
LASELVGLDLVDADVSQELDGARARRSRYADELRHRFWIWSSSLQRGGRAGAGLAI